MTLIRKLFVLLALAALWAPSACKEESAKKDQGDAHPAIADLLQTIEDLELAEARGMVLTSTSSDNQQVFKRIVKRSKIGAGLLRRDDASIDGITELVRSRDELQTLVLLSEDVDVITAYRAALDKAIREICKLQGRSAYDLGDPNVYREIYFQDFNLDQKLGDFSTFIESRTTKGPKLFQPGTCAPACSNNLEFAITDVNQSQAVWLVSPKIDLPDSADLKLTLIGSLKGEVSNARMKGLRIFASETFDGRFTVVENNWVDLTSLFDRYPANGMNDKTPAFKEFETSLWLDQFRGKSITLAVRVQGISNSLTTFEIKKLAIMGKGTASRTALTLIAPEPLLLADVPTPTPTPTPKPSGTPTPGPTATPNPSQNGFAYDGIDKVCADPVNGVVDIKESCRLALDSPTAEQDYLLPKGQNASASFVKLNFARTITIPAQAGGWRAITPSKGNCNDKITDPKIANGFCVTRFAKQSADLLVTPRIKLDGKYTIKLWHAPVGLTVNKKAAGVKVPKRLRTLIMADLQVNTTGTKVDSVIAKALNGTNVDFGTNLAAESDNKPSVDFDVPFSNYPAAEVVDASAASLTESILNKDVLSAQLGSASEFRLGLFENLMGDQATDNSTYWYVYAITFIKAEN